MRRVLRAGRGIVAAADPLHRPVRSLRLGEHRGQGHLRLEDAALVRFPVELQRHAARDGDVLALVGGDVQAAVLERQL
eukprot:COSAG06_NODE_30162_length_543_cov_1.637387_1_plen_77_part_01